MRHALKGMILAAALTTGGAFAHQTNPQCDADGVQVRKIANFAFTSKQAADFHAELERRPPGSGGSCPAGGGTKSCGQVDDHWDVVTLMSGEYCAKVDPRPSARALRVAPVAMALGPASYLREDHHQKYTYRSAEPTDVVLWGVCVICEVPAVSKAPKAKSGR
ncbi:hypothetical protein [Lysobacter sp. CA199]|uniref:hypothetical protein n=1 Tax=Lysobacter sp. CA199 TaxID=3455608 RepID=UPI003F8D8953